MLGLCAAAQVCHNTQQHTPPPCLVLLPCSLSNTNASHAHPHPHPSPAQVIVLHAENPWGNKFGNIPAILFGYINDDGVLDFAVCGNPLYANYFLNPETATAPPTAPTLKVRGTRRGCWRGLCPVCVWPHPPTSSPNSQECHPPALGVHSSCSCMHSSMCSCATNTHSPSNRHPSLPCLCSLPALTPLSPPKKQPTLAQATFTSGLSEGEDFTVLGSFEAKCGVRGQGSKNFLGGDPHKSSKFRIKAVTKPCFTKFGE